MATWIQKPYLFWCSLTLYCHVFCCNVFLLILQFLPQELSYMCVILFLIFFFMIQFTVSAQLLYSAFFPLFFREDWHMEENRRGCDMIDICCQYEVQNPWVLLTGVNRTKYSFQLQKYFIAAAHQIILTFETTIVSPKLCITITVSPLIRSPN